VVVRYFGGTLLGVGGLINAYRKACHEALKNARIIKKHLFEVYHILFPYTEMNGVMKLIKTMNLEYYDHSIGQNCELKVKIPLEKSVEFISQITRKKNIISNLILNE